MYWFSSAITIFLRGWLWHEIAHEYSHAIKQQGQTNKKNYDLN